MKIYSLKMSPFVYYCLVFVAGMCVVLYLGHTIKMFLAFRDYQTFTEATLTDKKIADDTHLRQMITTAVNTDRNNAEYAHALGRYHLKVVVADQSATTPVPQTQELDEAERWLQKAVQLDPGNPEYYYHLGRVGYYRGDCLIRHDISVTNLGAACSTARYFWAALQNAPKNMFLRKETGQLFCAYNREAAITMMRKLIADDTGNFMQNPGQTANEFSRVLYDLHMDYESDLVLERVKPMQLMPSPPTILAQSDSEGQTYELGDNDGSAEWNTRLVSQTERVKKVIELPKQPEKYDYAALKLFMNRGPEALLEMKIWLDDHLITLPDDLISVVPTWHEVAFDPAILQGKSHLTISIRGENLCEPDNYLQIWGDQDTPTIHSTWGWKSTDDLSAAPGRQRGEYMIRLLVKSGKR
jgi:tetratricopeptide (TPR) repeat protein